MIQLVRLVPIYSAAKDKLDLKDDIILRPNFKSIPSLFANMEKAINELAEDEKVNLFYTINHNAKGNRRKFEACEAIAFDIDKISLLEKENYIPLIAEATGTDPKKCGIIFSGNGIQYVILLKEKITEYDKFKEGKAHYKYWATRISESLAEAGLPHDVDTTVYDHARILRCPHTKNVKPMALANRALVEQRGNDKEKATELNEKLSVLLNGHVEYCGFELITEESTAFIEGGSTNAVNSFGKPDKESILRECGFLAHAKDNHSEFTEPLWYATLGITAHLGDNHESSHNLSRNHSGYDYNGTQSKSEQALHNSGPRTCGSVSELWDGCKSCKYFGKIVTPLQIKAESFIATEETGFSTIRNGKVRREHLDLRRYLDKTHPYVLIGPLERVMVYGDGYWTAKEDAWIKNYAQRHYKPECTNGTEINEFMNLVKRENYVDLSWLDVRKTEGFINLSNGILDVKKKTLSPHTSDYNFLYKLPYNYDPSAKCPTWDRLLQNVTLDRQHLVDVIEEYLGYILLGGEYSLADMLILSGGGSNGKTTLINAFKDIIGHDNFSAIPISGLEKNSFMAASLEGKLANFSEEEPVTAFSDTGALKKITGNSPMYVENKFEKGYNMTNRAKVIMTYNEIPFLKDITEGMKRRLLVIPFDMNTKTHPDRVIQDVSAKIREELPGILNRAIKAAERLLARGHFEKPQESLDIVKGMVYDSSPFEDYYDAYVVVTGDASDKVSCQALFKHYAECNGGAGMLTQRGITKKLKEKLKGTKAKYDVYKLDERSFRGFSGIRLNQDQSISIASSPY
jgi:P4 family phage/plasmid primase-like protien